jgi:SAM-dependent methyltransferase
VIGDISRKQCAQHLLQRARALIEDGHLADAREILLGIMERNSKPGAVFLLARIALKEKNPALAEKYLQPYSSDESQGYVPLFLMGWANEQLGRYRRAAEFYERAHAREPCAAEPGRGLARIRIHLLAENARKHFQEMLGEIEELLKNGDVDSAVQTATGFKVYSDLMKNLPWHEDGLLAKAAHFTFREDCLSAVQSYDADLISMSVEYGYLDWPRRIQRFMLNRSVLDVGCGFGGYGTGFLAAGARTYTGLDPAMDLDSTAAKNKRLRVWTTMPRTPRQIMESIPQINFIQGKAEDIAHSRRYDVISLHNVTEHLIEIDRVFEGFKALMTPDSIIVFLHHHFYGWNGHHHAPVKPEDYLSEDEVHRKYADWAHVIHGEAFAEDDYINTGLNQITLSELRTLTEGHFEIVEWQEQYYGKSVLVRLTPAIIKAAMAAKASLTKKDLEVRTVFCVAKSKT